MELLNNQVNSVRVFRPARLRAYGDEDWKQTVASALKLCKKRITSMVGNRVREGREAEQCQEANDVFADCLDGQLFLVSYNWELFLQKKVLHCRIFLSLAMPRTGVHSD